MSGPYSAEERFKRLKDWRDAPGASDGRERLTDDDLLRIAHQGGTSADTIRRVPAANRTLIARLSGPIAAVVSAQGTAPPPPPPPPAPPASKPAPSSSTVPPPPGGPVPYPKRQPGARAPEEAFEGPQAATPDTPNSGALVAKEPFSSAAQVPAEQATPLLPDPETQAPAQPEAPDATEPETPALPEESEFARYQPTATPAEGRETVQVQVDENGRVTWSPLNTEAEAIVYRVVAGDEGEPPAPEFGRLVAITTDPTADDGNPFKFAVRYYTVWANSGATLAEAAASQPRLWAKGATVAPVSDCTILENQGQVIGNWVSAQGTTRVDVRRHEPGERRYRPSDILQPEDPVNTQLLGFVDNSATPGQDYEYSVYAVAVVGGNTRFSAPVTRAVTIPVVPDQVTELEATQRAHKGKSVLDITWTQPPVGAVQLYLTREQPDPALSRQGAIDLERLETTPLQPTARIANPPKVEGKRHTIVEVPWPHDWYSAYITPVTFAGKLAHIGASRPFKRMDPVRDAQLRERVDTQMIVFDWPDGAAHVLAFVTPPGGQLDQLNLHTPYTQLSEQEYRNQGGMLVNLDGARCDVHLVPVAFERGRPQYGDGVRLPYPGLVRIRYRLYREEIPAKGFIKMKKKIVEYGPWRVEVIADRDLSEGVEFIWVSHRDRLPLRPGDSTAPPATKTIPLSKGVKVTVFEYPGELPAGYYRLFARSPGIPSALLDPDVAGLRR